MENEKNEKKKKHIKQNFTSKIEVFMMLMCLISYTHAFLQIIQIMACGEGSCGCPSSSPEDRKKGYNWYAVFALVVCMPLLFLSF